MLLLLDQEKRAFAPSIIRGLFHNFLTTGTIHNFFMGKRCALPVEQEV